MNSNCGKAMWYSECYFVNQHDSLIIMSSLLSHYYVSLMFDHVFENWFMEHFIPLVADDQKLALVIYDGHGSHLTFKTVEGAMENDIKFVCLPPNCSHALQQLDMAVFKPVKVD